MKRVLGAIGAVAACGLSASALAATVDLGDISAGESNGSSLFYADPGVHINDTWSFTLSQSLVTAIVLDSAELAGFYGISDFAVDDGGAGLDFAFDSHDNSYSFSGLLAPGTYNLTVTGTTNGALGGEYEVAVGSQAAVPIPAPIALFGSGIFALGALRRRRSGGA
jgi:hypothetical protein